MNTVTIKTVDNFNFETKCEFSHSGKIHKFRIDELIYRGKIIAVSSRHEYSSKSGSKNIDLEVRPLQLFGFRRFTLIQFKAILLAYGVRIKDINKYLHVINTHLFKYKDYKTVFRFEKIVEFELHYTVDKNNKIQDMKFFYPFNEEENTCSLSRIIDLFTTYYGSYMEDMFRKVPEPIQIIDHIIHILDENVELYGLAKPNSDYPNFDKFKEDYKDYKLCLDFAEGFEKLLKDIN